MRETMAKTQVAPAMVALPAEILLAVSDHVREVAHTIVEKERNGDVCGAADVARALGYIHGKLSFWVDHARSAVQYEVQLREEVAQREKEAADEAQLRKQPVKGAPPFENGVHGVDEDSIERVVEGLERFREDRERRMGLASINRGDPAEHPEKLDATDSNPLR